jgi:Polyketide cyclase / dehydrase and lipid transport
VAAIKVVVERTVDGTPENVVELLADYAGTRADLLPEMIDDYRVVEGGRGAGTRISYRLHATRRRVRDVEAVVSAPDAETLVETDQRSSLRTVWTVRPAGSAARVTATTSWEGAGGVGGFFERTFAPIGIRKLNGGILEKLAARLS